MTAGDAELAAARRDFARVICERAGVRSDALREAFAAVSREAFLGPGPWEVVETTAIGEGYHTTPDADPRALYRDVLVALDRERLLNNGAPSSLAAWIDALGVRPGDRVAHVGCGVGYYTAILAHLVGASGDVLGVEADPGLAARAERSLRGAPNAAVAAGDGSRMPLGERDVIFVNAGATSPRPWLPALAPEGRLLVPLTLDVPNNVTIGNFLLVSGREPRRAARFVSPVMIYACQGARSAEEEALLRASFEAGGVEGVASLRSDDHAAEASCWYHRDGACVSTETPDRSAASG